MIKILKCLLVVVSTLYMSAVDATEIEKMTLEEKVGQLFITYFEGDEANEQAERLIKETKLGGIIYYKWSNGLTDPSQVREMSHGLQRLSMEHAKIPLFIAVDQEGGAVARLQNGFTEFPGNAALGRTKQAALAYEMALAMGSELQAVGINWNFAPVVDIHTNPKNPVIGIRSFGEDRETVAAFGGEAVKGFLDSGIIPCLKHFPGHGDVSVDPHKALPSVSKDYQELQKVELYPFIKLSQSAPAIMTAHILLPKIDPHNCATVSSAILGNILRERLKYDGVVISDSLTMKGALEGHGSLEEVAIRAFNAGNDILLIGGRDLQDKEEGETYTDEFISLYQGFLTAVRTGRISEERVNDSVRRILSLKQREWKPSREESLWWEDHLGLAREIAYRSVSVKKGRLPVELAQKRVAVVATKLLQEKIQETMLAGLGRETVMLIFDGLEPTALEHHQILEKTNDVDYIVFCSYNAWRSPRQLELLESLAAAKPTTCIASRDPYDLEVCAHSEVLIATYSPTACSLQVAAEWLLGATRPLKISSNQAQCLGQKIWYNECRNRVDQLTFWNENEEFPSMGIGHFIWPPKEYEGTFSRGRFHNVLEFMQEDGAHIPFWISQAKYSPWATRGDFYADFDSEKMLELRSFLVETVPYQALYMVDRLNHAFAEIVMAAPVSERAHVVNQFFRVARRPGGPYILVDYLNFKHEGTDLKERYKGQGWGLLQVLQNMGDGDVPEEEFMLTSKLLLKRRIANSPDPQKEQRWLPGWMNRLDTYHPFSE